MRTRGLNLLPTIVALTILSTLLVPAHCLQCRFKLATYNYDLCPLLFTFESSISSINSASRHIHIHQDTSTPPTVTRSSYDFDLGGEGLKKDPNLPETDQCPDGTWICLRISNIRPNHISERSRIIQVIPISGNIQESGKVDRAPQPQGVNATARLVTPKRTNKQTNPVVEVVLNGGWYLSHPQRAVINFRCDESITEPSIPVPSLFQHDLSSRTSHHEMSDSPQTHSHVFTWDTKHACPLSQDETPQPSRTAEPPSGSSHPSKGKQGDEGNISPEAPLAPGSDGMGPMSMVKAAGIIIGSILALAVCYEVYVTQIQRRKQWYFSLSRGNASDTRLTSLGVIIPPLPSLSFSLPSFLRRFRRSPHRTSVGSRLATIYDPLVAEEYEIQGEDEDGAVVDFQSRGFSHGHKARKNGYGSVR